MTKIFNLKSSMIKSKKLIVKWPKYNKVNSLVTVFVLQPKSLMMLYWSMKLDILKVEGWY